MLVTVQKKDEEARTPIKGELPEERDTQAAQEPQNRRNVAKHD
jgi:hypothetical protein